MNRLKFEDKFKDIEKHKVRIFENKANFLIDKSYGATKLAVAKPKRLIDRRSN